MNKVPKTPCDPNDIAPLVVLDTLRTAVLVVDRRRTVVYLNQAAEELLGASARQLRGHSLDYLLHDPALDAIVRETLERHQTVLRYDLDFGLPGSPPRRVDCWLTAIDGAEHGSLLIEIAPNGSISDAQRDSQLLAQQEANRLMLQGLAHEIKNPLGGLRGAAQLLERELTDPALTEYTRIIIGEADRLKNLIDRVLSPGTASEISRLSVHEVLERVRTLVAADLPPGLTIECDYDPSLPDLRGDREQLIQALLNLVQNAVQAVDEGNVRPGRVILRTRVRRRVTIAGHHHRLVAQVDVVDNGPGVAEHLREQIFHPLVTGRPAGTGLGLSVAQSLINRHGGCITFHSQPGNTVFSVLLPLAGERP